MDESPQLHMIWPAEEAAVRPEHLHPPRVYCIRTYLPGDEEDFLRLAVEGEFDQFDGAKLQSNIAKVIPGGWFFATRIDTGAVCGTAMCLHNYTGLTPFTGDVGWVVCSPADRGHGLGVCLTACVTQRFSDAGYSRIQLHTEHYRLAAIKTYLRAGYRPVIESVQAHALWREACMRLNWKFTPDDWPRLTDPQHTPDGER